MKDPVELAYERAILAASSDPDEAQYLAIGLKQYRTMFKVEDTEGTPAE